MNQRCQRTIRSEVTTSGVGFITGADVRLRFLPAPDNHGIVFQRVDLPGQPCVAATLENLIPRQRRTGLSKDGATIELVEHVLSACVGLQVDNCVVQLDAPETPGFDGSCQAVVDCLIAADFEEQDSVRDSYQVAEPATVTESDGSQLTVKPFSKPGLTISYVLDYGDESPLPAQTYSLSITPETFVNEICFARTFVLESEVAALKNLGYGTRTTYQDLLVFGSEGVIDNSMHVADECARHKILDCIGDFALLGCDLQGYFSGWRTGHNTNHALMQLLKEHRQTAGDKIEIAA